MAGSRQVAANDQPDLQWVAFNYHQLVRLDERFSAGHVSFLRDQDEWRMVAALPGVGTALGTGVEDSTGRGVVPSPGRPAQPARLIANRQSKIIVRRFIITSVSDVIFITLFVVRRFPASSSN